MIMICKCEIYEKRLYVVADCTANHDVHKMRCNRTNCLYYRPRRDPNSPVDWPRCVCGAIVQDHG